MAPSALTWLVTPLAGAATHLLCHRQLEEEESNLEEYSPGESGLKKQTPLNLETIPLDVLYLITAHLDYPTALALTSTSKSLYNTLKPGLCSPKSNLPIPLSTKIAFFRLAETTFPQNAHDLTCFTCFRLLPKSEFSPKNRTGYKGTADWAMHESMCDHYDRSMTRRTYRDRFCWTCGIAQLKFPHLTAIRRNVRRRGRHVRDRLVKDAIYAAERKLMGDGLLYLCHQCGEMKPKENRCFLVPWLDEPGEGEGRAYPRTICSGVFEERVVEGEKCDAAIINNDIANEPSKPSTLEDLPLPVQQMIFALLPYRDRIMLSQTSRHFHTTVQPSWREYPIHDKYPFIRHQKRTKDRARNILRKVDIACYGCFRMRPLAKFSEFMQSRRRT